MLCRSKAWIIDHLKAKQSPWISADQSIGDPFFPFVLGMPSMIYAWLRRNGIMLGFSYANHVNIHHILMFFRENGWNLECPLRPSNSWIYTLMVFHLLTGLHRKICEITSQNPMKTTDSLKSTPQCYGKMPAEVTMFDSQAPQEPVLKCAWSTVWALLPMKSPYVVSIKVYK